MKSYLISLDKISNFVIELAKDGEVYYPKLDNGKVHLTAYVENCFVDPDFTGIRTAENVKHFFFRSRDVVAHFPKDKT